MSTQTKNDEIKKQGDNMIITAAGVGDNVYQASVENVQGIPEAIPPKENDEGIELKFHDAKLYPKEFMAVRYRNHFITIPKTTIKHESIVDMIYKFPSVKYVAVAKESHKDKTNHYHILIQNNKHISRRFIHKHLEKLNGKVKGSINYQQTKNFQQSLKYIQKEGNVIEKGEYGLRGYTQGLSKVIMLAEEGLTNEAIQEFKNDNPVEYIKNKDGIENNLKNMSLNTKKFPLPDMTKVELYPWQQYVYDLIQSTPQQRRVIWVHGEYATGKSYFLSYLAEKHNYPYGVYVAGQTCSLDSLAYNYDEEGAIIWDIPKNFNWQDLLEPLCNVVEKFSDYGQVIQSNKYKGKTQHVRGHAMVFSNDECPVNLKHRDIIEVRVTSTDKYRVYKS